MQTFRIALIGVLETPDKMDNEIGHVLTNTLVLFFIQRKTSINILNSN